MEKMSILDKFLFEHGEENPCIEVCYEKQFSYLYSQKELSYEDMRKHLSGYVGKKTGTFISNLEANILCQNSKDNDFFRRMSMHPDYNLKEYFGDYIAEEFWKVLIDPVDFVVEVVISGKDNTYYKAFKGNCIYVSFLKELLSFFGYRVRVRMEE